MTREGGSMKISFEILCLHFYGKKQKHIRWQLISLKVICARKVSHAFFMDTPDARLCNSSSSSRTSSHASLLYISLPLTHSHSASSSLTPSFCPIPLPLSPLPLSPSQSLPYSSIHACLYNQPNPLFPLTLIYTFFPLPFLSLSLLSTSPQPHIDLG